ncbi:hypothetical protein BJX70DRAFT_360555 [Aspergillus crustosus]
MVAPSKPKENAASPIRPAGFANMREPAVSVVPSNIWVPSFGHFLASNHPFEPRLLTASAHNMDSLFVDTPFGNGILPYAPGIGSVSTADHQFEFLNGQDYANHPDLSVSGRPHASSTSTIESPVQPVVGQFMVTVSHELNLRETKTIQPKLQIAATPTLPFINVNGTIARAPHISAASTT